MSGKEKKADEPLSDNAKAAPRILVMSMAFSPCPEVGGKRFSYLSSYLADRCGEYHVLARREKKPIKDSEAFIDNVHRLRAFPDYSPAGSGWIKRQLLKIWERWLCVADPYCGWVVPATIHGIRLCRRHSIESIIVTVPYFSSLIAAVLVSRSTGAKLILDYRDPWTNHRNVFPGMFGAAVSRYIEIKAIRQACAIVFCSDVMRDQFASAFSSVAPDRLEVIYNGFEERPSTTFNQTKESGRIHMLYAGNFYGKRQLSVIASVLADMVDSGEISAENFCFHLYSNLLKPDFKVLRDLGLEAIVQVHGLVSYQEIQKRMSEADILFLLSGDDVSYAVPFKFFDYLRAHRPILAVAPRGSTVETLMAAVDCGEYADFADSAEIRQALSRLVADRGSYSFEGADQFHWSNAARKYFRLIQDVTGHAAPGSVLGAFRDTV